MRFVADGLNYKGSKMIKKQFEGYLQGHWGLPGATTPLFTIHFPIEAVTLQEADSFVADLLARPLIISSGARESKETLDDQFGMHRALFVAVNPKFVKFSNTGPLGYTIDLDGKETVH